MGDPLIDRWPNTAATRYDRASDQFFTQEPEIGDSGYQMDDSRARSHYDAGVSLFLCILGSW